MRPRQDWLKRLLVKSPALTHFLRATAAEPELQARCAAVASLAELVAVAQAAGFVVSERELQLWVHDQAFQAPWWPWAKGGSGAQTAFFRDQP
jgi:hypothetical protein